MSNGYLLFAIDTDATDYTRLAYACALSIKITQPKLNSISIVTNNLEKFKNKLDIFDHVIEYTGPLGMDCRSRAYELTPYEETVLLDSDMLFLNNMEVYWDYIKDRDLFITTTPQNYKREVFKYGPYRKFFEKYQLTDVYNAWTYFKKSPVADEFFNLVKDVTDNPKEFMNSFFTGEDFKSFPTDEAFALAIQILDLEELVTESLWDFPRITHMKPMVQGWQDYTMNWTDKIRFSLDSDAKVKLGMFQQTDLLHYVDKSIITDSIIKTLEDLCVK